MLFLQTLVATARQLLECASRAFGNMSPRTADWFVVVNPVAGRGRALRLRPRIEAALRRAGIAYRFAVSEGAGHAVQLARQGIGEGYRHLLAVGGDGTVHEMVNGALTQRICASSELTLGVVPLGTGNDWARGLGVPARPEVAIGLLRTGHVGAHDVGVAEFPSARARHYFMNIAGAGFDATVVARMPARKRSLTYVGGVLGALSRYRPVPVMLRTDKAERALDLFAVFACIGRYFAGGMRVAPGALADDGQFDITAIASLTRLDALLSIRRLYDGSLLEHPKVSSLRCQSLELAAAAPIGVEADGEWLGQTPVRFELLPAALSVVRAAP